MIHFAKLSRLLFAMCLLLGIALMYLARPGKARAAGDPASAQSVRRELPVENKPQTGQAYGIYPAIVMSQPDPHMRVQIKVPSLNINGEWAEACVPVGNKSAPPISSRVWVMFEQGNTHYPVWMGVPGN